MAQLDIARPLHDDSITTVVFEKGVSMKHSMKLRGLVLAALFLVPAATAAAEDAADAAADETIEEIVVTGTRVRRSSFDSASPLSIITADDLDSLGISGLSDLTATLPFTLGNITNSSLIATALGGGNCCVDLADNPVNLRGLGSEGTLQLINGKRTLIKNINLLAPMIAIDRLEVLKDGASALYGSEAVGGVVNLMTVREFDGLELWLSADMTTEDPKGAFNPNRQRDQMWQNAAEVMWGRTGDRTSFVAALSYFERDPLHNADRPELTGRAFGTSGSGQPGTFSVQNRLPLGLDGSPPGLSGTARSLIDPECENPNFAGSDVPGTFQWKESGIRMWGSCRFDYNPHLVIFGEEERIQSYMYVKHEFSDHVRFDTEVTYSRLKSIVADTGSTGAQVSFIPGDHPANPGHFAPLVDDGGEAFGFTAHTPGRLVDADGDGVPDVDASGNPVVEGPRQRLFAQDVLDVNGDPIAGGDGRPDRGANGQVIVVGTDPNATVMDAFGNPVGVMPFNDDIVGAAVRTIGKQFLNPDFPQNWNTGDLYTDSDIFRIASSLQVDVADTGWLIDLSTIYHSHNYDSGQMGNITFSRLLADALVGKGGDAGDQWFNPFGNSRYLGDAETRPGSPLYNSPEIYDWFMGDYEDSLKDTLLVAEAYATGDLLEGWAGPIGVAVGAHWRREFQELRFGVPRSVTGPVGGGQAGEYRYERDISAFYAEAVIPLVTADTQALELQVAARYEDLGAVDTTDPKVSLLYRRDTVNVRASYGTSFLAPTPADQFASEDRAFETLIDPINGDFAGSFRASVFAGNPNLEPQSADVYNIGASWAPDGVLDGLLLEADYWRFDYTDQIVTTTALEIITAEYDRFLAAGHTAGDPNDVATFLASPGRDRRVGRDARGHLTNVRVSKINAAAVLTSGVDLHARYDLGLGDFGDLVFDLSAVYVSEFEYQQRPSDPEADGVGRRNARTAIAYPTPEWRFNLSARWSMGRHAVTGVVHYFSDVENLNAIGFPTNPAEIKGNAILDLQYAITLPFGLTGRGGESHLSVGMFNVTNESPTSLINDLQGYDWYLEDPRGRRVYVQFRQSLGQ